MLPPIFHRKGLLWFPEFCINIRSQSWNRLCVGFGCRISATKANAQNTWPATSLLMTAVGVEVCFTLPPFQVFRWLSGFKFLKNAPVKGMLFVFCWVHIILVHTQMYNFILWLTQFHQFRLESEYLPMTSHMKCYFMSAVARRLTCTTQWGKVHNFLVKLYGFLEKTLKKHGLHVTIIRWCCWS